MGEQEFARHVHGETGLGDVVLPEPDRGPDSDDAVGYLVETTRSEEGLHLVPEAFECVGRPGSLGVRSEVAVDLVDV